MRLQLLCISTRLTESQFFGSEVRQFRRSHWSINTGSGLGLFSSHVILLHLKMTIFPHEGLLIYLIKPVMKSPIQSGYLYSLTDEDTSFSSAEDFHEANQANSMKLIKNC